MFVTVCLFVCLFLFCFLITTDSLSVCPFVRISILSVFNLSTFFAFCLCVCLSVKLSVYQLRALNVEYKDQGISFKTCDLGQFQKVSASAMGGYQSNIRLYLYIRLFKHNISIYVFFCTFEIAEFLSLILINNLSKFRIYIILYIDIQMYLL